jgi:PAS domain S-box-containing protein
VTYNRKSGLPHDLVLTIHGDQRGDVWIGTPGGLSRFRDGRFRLFTTADGLTSNVVSAVLPSRDGALWIGTSGGGLHRLVGQRILPVVLDRDSVGAAILSLLEEPDGTIWIGTDGRGLYRLSGQQWTRFGRNSGLSSEIVLSLHRDAAGTIWIGTAGGGLVRYKAGRMRAITRQQGLFDDTVFQVLEDRTGNFWMGSNRGIFRVPVSELESVADGRLGRVSGTSFGTSHGLASIEVNGGIFPPGWRRRDGTLWFPTVAGIAVTDGEVRERHQMPSVVLDSLNVDGKKMEPESQPLVLPPGSSRLQLRFTMPTFVMPASRQFRYRLEGWDSRWVYAENLGRADYNHLAPGRYTFYVSARLGEGPWSPAKPLLSFSIRPYFYQTLWFRMGVILIALAAGLALHHAATRALRRRQDQLLGLIEKRERAERSLRESEEHFRALIESTSDLTLIADEEGAIYYVSPASKTILGLESNEVMKWRLAELIPADQLKLLLARLETEETALTTVTFDKSRSIQRQLEIVTHRLNCEPQKGRFLVNCRDVSERNLLEKRLQQSDRVAGLGRIAASVAHEFNNVLMGIQPFAEALKRTEKSERVQSLSGNIIDSVRRGKKVTQEILRFVRGAEPVLQPVQVAPWSRRLETELISLVGKSVEVSVTAADNLVMKADPEQITQVMINLALNARDAMPDGGVLEVHFRQASDLDRRRFTLPDTQWIRASVSDTGSGIPPDILPHIFEPLFTTKKHSGNGLGLALVHQVMERHQGQVFVESRPGCTTFILFLPMTSVNENPSTEPSAEVRVSSRSILLIEDDLLVAEGIRLLLSEHGWGVALATAGEEGLAMLDTVDPDVVILDLGLSDMDGLTVFARLMDRRPEIPVVFSTGHGDQAELEQLRSTAHVDFLLKPYDAKALIEKIEAVIASSLNSRLRIPLASA